MRKIASLFTLLAIASLQFLALARNRVGHMVSGAIAYSELNVQR